VSETLTIRSHRGPYTVVFDDDALANENRSPADGAHYVVDRRVADLYGDGMRNILAHRSLLLIDASEDGKSLDRFPAYVDHLVGRGVRRDQVLVAIGGGIVQDITCFLAATLLRGIAWKLLPTTLLAMADSCIGSKSSINAGSAKNILGTFTPPTEVLLSTRFLATLDEKDVRSGAGEMLKVHAIDGPRAFDEFAAGYRRLLTDPAVMRAAIRRSLEIKKRYIEDDEFDRGPRNVFNYGHTFGHAIEAATDFAVPHGIAVTIGMDMANHLAARLGLGAEAHRDRMHPVLSENFRGFADHPVPIDRFAAAIAKDKKNVGKGAVTLILPDRSGRLFKNSYACDGAFIDHCARYLDHDRRV
jgi:3-dehydroquinate synthase